MGSDWGVTGSNCRYYRLRVLGIIVGPFIGALLGELIVRREGGQTVKSAFGTIIGFLAGTLLKIIVVMIMIGFFVASWF